MADVVCLGFWTWFKSVGLTALLSSLVVCPLGISLAVSFGRYNAPFCPQAVRVMATNKVLIRWIFDIAMAFMG